ncbi:hypothetical protein Pmani_010400 [Petrolisthes manimaculis]|uniref:Uncharacterized protein n=1 Tax=Petrolisthes manimaculis TaxID=1843537 RepID=A0AAE1Q1N7_9EUCA|nr:hypothetical protein Pmani_010400 [Petrolisthes manimaculis]
MDNVSTEKEVYSTYGDHVLCSCVDQDVSELALCSHEEADTCILLQAMDAVEKSYGKIMLRTVDTNVVVLAVSAVVLLENTQMWIALGTGKHLIYIPAHQIATSLGAEKARALLMFHAFISCDTVSSFAGKGKKQPSTHGGRSMLLWIFSLDVSHDLEVSTKIVCRYWSHMWFLCMTEKVQKPP